ncbi:hypothetical protein SP19_46 [Salmonella phage 19]|nr:hypothetical protein SP19_46 [Salmonella phage 19]
MGDKTGQTSEVLNRWIALLTLTAKAEGNYLEMNGAKVTPGCETSSLSPWRFKMTDYKFL